MKAIYYKHIVNNTGFVTSVDSEGQTLLDVLGNKIEKLICNLQIVTQIDGCPYPGKFLQYDQVELELNPELPANTLNDQLPVLIQNWITQQYPDI